jgi:diguanylate cyclase
MEDAEAAIATLRALKELGISLAIDDFGTGYSSLSYLKRFPIDVLKIDKSFVQSLPTDEEDAAIVTTLSVLGHSLQLILHAEGVETEAQAQFLRRLGVHRIQGYSISRPAKPSDIMRMLRERNSAPVAPAPRVPITAPHKQIIQRTIVPALGRLH